MPQVEATSKAVEASLGKTQESKPGVERVTLGAVVGCINSTRAEKLVSNHARKTLMESFHQPSRHGVVAKDEVKVPYSHPFGKGKARTTARSSYYRQGKDDLACKKPETERTLSNPLSLRLSKTGYSVSFLTRNETENNHDGRETQRNKTNSQNRSPTWGAKDTQGDCSSSACCSPYKRIYTPVITVNNDETSSHNHVELENTSCRKPSQSRSSNELEFKSTETHGASEAELDNREKRLDGLFMRTMKDLKTIEEHATPNDRDVLNRFTDRELKESLENIIKTRRSSVRLVRSESGYGLVNLSDNGSGLVNRSDNGSGLVNRSDHDSGLVNLSDDGSGLVNRSDNNFYNLCKAENMSPQYNEQQRPGPLMEAEKPLENHLQSVTARKKSATHEWSPSAPISVPESFRGEGLFQMRPRSQKATGQESGRVTTTKISSAQSLVSTASNWTQRSLSSPLLRRRKTAFQTGETRVVLPGSAKAYTPTFTQRRPRKKSSVSCPESSPHDKQKAKTLRETAMVREFLLMYAKVKTKKIGELHGQSKPVTMLSQTPELVIKSAIGQFLTRAFPSEQNADSEAQSNLSKAERHEEQQRCRLLRIKICMKHLAAVA